MIFSVGLHSEIQIFQSSVGTLTRFLFLRYKIKLYRFTSNPVASREVASILHSVYNWLLHSDSDVLKPRNRVLERKHFLTSSESANIPAHVYLIANPSLFSLLRNSQPKARAWLGLRGFDFLSLQIRVQVGGFGLWISTVLKSL